MEYSRFYGEGPDGVATVELKVTKKGQFYIPKTLGPLWRGIKHVALLRRGEDESVLFCEVLRCSIRNQLL